MERAEKSEKSQGFALFFWAVDLIIEQGEFPYV